MRILLAIALVALAGCDYQEWSAERERNAKLSYGPLGDRDWQYVNDGDVQYSPRNGSMFLRKVKSKEHVVVARLHEDGFQAMAYWKADCEAGTEIETSKTYSSGNAMMLECTQSGGSTWLSAGVVRRDSNEPGRWAQDYDGFAVKEDFRDWDWTKAKQYATLQKAKPADSQEDE